MSQLETSINFLWNLVKSVSCTFILLLKSNTSYEIIGLLFLSFSCQNNNFRTLKQFKIYKIKVKCFLSFPSDLVGDHLLLLNMWLILEFSVFIISMEKFDATLL